MKFIAIFTTAILGVGDPAQQFGLRCELQAPGTEVRYTNVYSIDLDRGVWCGVDVEANACHERRTAPLTRVDAAELELLPSEYRNGRRRAPMIVNRTNGILTSDLLTGQCSKVEFTPLPEAVF
jgi:hypothetical protein